MASMSEAWEGGMDVVVGRTYVRRVKGVGEGKGGGGGDEEEREGEGEKFHCWGCGVLGTGAFLI